MPIDVRKKVHLVNFTRKLTVNSTFFLIPLYYLRLGFNAWQVGGIVSIFGIAPLLVAFPTGWINDRFSMQRVIRGALLVQGLAFLLLSRVRVFSPIAVCFLLIGLGNNVLDVSTNSLYFKEGAGASGLNRKYSRLVFWLNLGTASGTILGGILTLVADFRLLFTVYAVLHFAVLLLVRNMGEETFEVVTLAEYGRGLLRRKAVLLSLLFFVLALHWGAEGTVYSPFLKQAFGLNNFEVALYISLALMMMAFSALSVGFLKTEPDTEGRLFVLGLLLSGAGLMLQTSPFLPFSFGARLVHEAGDGVIGALGTLFISRLFDKRNIGGSSGLLLAVVTTGHIAGAQISSLLGFTVGLHIPFLLLGGLLVANSAFGYHVFRRERY